MNSTLKRLLSFLMALSMVMSLVVMPAGAEEDPAAPCEHEWAEQTTAATCTTDGATTKTCGKCGATETVTLTAPGHAWNAGEVTTAAACTTDGVKTFTCGTCGDTYTETITAVGHSYGEDGKCGVCGAEKPAEKSAAPAQTPTECTCETLCSETAGCDFCALDLNNCKHISVDPQPVVCGKNAECAAENHETDCPKHPDYVAPVVCDKTAECKATENHDAECEKAKADAAAAAAAEAEAASAKKVDEVNALIDALPETVTAENYEAVMAQLTAIMAKQAEMGDLWAQINQEKLNAVILMTQTPAPPIDTTIDTIAELQSAVAEQTGATVTVDTVLSVASGETVNLDLNGCTINLLSIENNGGTLSISNGTLNGIATSNSTIQQNSGKLTLSNVTVTGKRHAVRIKAGEVIISSGNYTAIYDANITNYAVNTSGGTLTISGGTFTGPGSKDSGGAAFIAQAGSTATIKGGKFVDSSIKTYTSGALAVKGGTFDEDLTNSQYVAAGYEVKAVDGGFWSVSEKVFAVTVTSADGTTSTGFDTLAGAVAACTGGETVTINESGTYGVAGMTKNMTITAADGVAATFDNIGEHNCSGANITFNNITFNYTNENYKGLQHSGNLTYNDCTINGQPFLYGSSETFNRCVFNQTDANAYNVWTYSADKVTFSGCIFNCAGKSVLVYNEGDGATDVTVTNCKFIASAPATGKAAIEIGTDSMGNNAPSDIVIDAATSATGFGTGSVSGNSLWNEKNGNKENATVTVAGKLEWPVYPIVVIDSDNKETGFPNLDAAVAACKGGETILINEGGTYNLPGFKAKELTFKGFDKEKVIINDAPASSQNWSSSSIHFENLTAEGNGNLYHGLAHTATVTYKSCNVNKRRFLYAENVSFDECAFNSNGCDHSFWTYGASTVTVNNSSFTYTDRAVNCYSEADSGHETDITFTGCTFNGGKAVEINSSLIKGIHVTMNGCTPPANGDMWYISSYDQEKGEKTIVDVNGVRVWPIYPFYIDANDNGKHDSTENGFNSALDAIQAANALASNVTVVCNAKPAAGTYTLNPGVTLSYNGNTILLPMGGTVTYDANGTATIKPYFNEYTAFGQAIVDSVESGKHTGEQNHILAKGAYLTLTAAGKLEAKDGEHTILFLNGKTPFNLNPVENKNTFVQTSTANLKFKSNMFFETYQSTKPTVMVDNVALKAGDFSAEKGSTIITLSNSLLRKLDVGVHTLSIVDSNAPANTPSLAECNFYVSPNYYGDDTNPKTGDSIFVPAAVLLISASALAVLLLSKKRRA